MKLFNSWLISQYRIPTFSNLLKRRKIVILLTAIVAVHLFMTQLGVVLWKCPVKSVLGFRCPGCGLSKAIVVLFHGNWQLAIREHLFAPFFVLGFLFMIAMVLLPVPLYQRVLNRMEWLEKKTGFFNAVMVGLVFYWAARMVVQAL
jgi:hypothetical protein